MYKYISNGSMISSHSLFGTTNFDESSELQSDAMKIKRMQAECNLPHSIVRRDDGGILKGWRLQGVFLVIRHGDRGPMAHVRGVSSIDCSGGHQNNFLLNKYRNFLLNTTTNAPSGHYIWNKNGPFHNFALLPSLPKACLLGQLTHNGIVQLLQIGDILRQVYAAPLGFFNRPIFNPHTSNITQSMSTYVNDEIIIYSTRYRRTFQSAMALMFAFLTSDRWLSLQVQESLSLAFCFSDCSCPKADQIRDRIAKEFTRQYTEHRTAAAVVHWIGSNVLQNPTPKMHPLEVRDAILTMICHNAPFPCRRNGRIEFQAKEEKPSAPMSGTTEDSNDVIIIDSDDTAAAAALASASVGANVASNVVAMPKDSENEIPVEDDKLSEPEIDGCVEASHVEELMEFTRWQGVNEAKHRWTRYHGLLRAYGLMRSIVNFMLKIISGDKVKFVLYSGHDRTLQFLIAALGLHAQQFNQSFHIPYATRLAFELYKSEAGNGDLSEYYFRVVSNGQDVTRLIEFCEGGRSLRIIKDSRGNKADLCPVENIIRFIHEDYFAELNATNFKDACAATKNNEL